ncbi:MAG: hypothetical protein HY885_15430 [Deltaproteobacteria bacterium]|nr:hypothetical protein [Deltaproteobacteria bacterium]
MTYTSEDFNQFCHEAAGQFLQTVVVIDNEAVFCDEPCDFFGQTDIPTSAIKERSYGVLGGQIVSAQEKTELSETPPSELAVNGRDDDKPPEEFSKNILMAKPLINAFADKGVVCSIIRPDLEDAEVVQRSITVASIADIVVVDWALGKKPGETEGQKAKEIIKGIIEGDLKKRGRLRLISIYTAENVPSGIIDDLFKHIKDMFEKVDPISKDSENFTIQNRFLKITVLLKTAAGDNIPNIKPVDFDALPEKLHELFAGLNNGLLPSVTLRAIAAIREGTHHLLTVLHKDLDSALVGHRCLLPYPEDAEEFCEDLVAGEIRSILALAKIGTKYVGKEQNELWVASRLDSDGFLNYGEFKAASEQISTLLSAEDTRQGSFIAGVKSEWAGRNKIQGRKAPTLDKNFIPQFLHGEEVGGVKSNHEFARLTSFKRESFGLRKPPKGWVPKLTLGTVLQRVADGKVFLCLQPRCESVRLDNAEKRIFPFLELGKGEQKECLIVNTVGSDHAPVEKKLFFEPKPKNQAIFEFTSTSGHAITANNENNFYIFEADEAPAQRGRQTTAISRFYWLGDLKDPYAQNIVGKMSDAVGSVGINPYEWQRRLGK